MKKIFITGATGLIGSRFVEMLPEGYLPITPTIDELDITNIDKLNSFIDKNAPDYIVHFAGITNVNEAEKEKGNKDGITWKVNVQGSENLAKITSSSKIGFLHVSTDFVFPGSKNDPGPYDEDHPLPKADINMSWYAWTKRMAEEEVLKNNNSSAIVRLMMPFRAKYDLKDDLLRTILKLYDQNKLYPMFTDQFITPTYIDEAMYAFNIIIINNFHGIFHTVCRGVTTPFEFAEYVLEKGRGVKDVIERSSIIEYLKDKNNAPRPIFGGLKTEKTQKELGLTFKSWQESVDVAISLIQQ